MLKDNLLGFGNIHKHSLQKRAPSSLTLFNRLCFITPLASNGCHNITHVWCTDNCICSGRVQMVCSCELGHQSGQHIYSQPATHCGRKWHTVQTYISVVLSILAAAVSPECLPLCRSYILIFTFTGGTE